LLFAQACWTSERALDEQGGNIRPAAGHPDHGMGYRQFTGQLLANETAGSRYQDVHRITFPLDNDAVVGFAMLLISAEIRAPGPKEDTGVRSRAGCGCERACNPIPPHILLHLLLLKQLARIFVNSGSIQWKLKVIIKWDSNGSPP
jgi:hypothetical protein